MRQVFLDIETTGLLVSEGHRVIEVGCVELQARKPSDNRLHLYINPERDSDPGAFEVHGLTREFLTQKPVFAAVAQDIRNYLQGADELIIHNAMFDLGFLNHEFKQLGLDPLEILVGRVVDSLEMANELYPGKRNSLNSLCDRLEVNRSGRTLHGALKDAQLLVQVYLGMTRGQDSLLIHPSDSPSGPQVERHDLRQYHPPVILPSPQEQEEHQAVLKQMNKDGKGQVKVLFRNLAQ